jgi:hypothetical protein
MPRTAVPAGGMAMAILAISCILAGAASVLSMIYFFFLMLGGVKPERRMLSQFLGPMMVLVPGLLNDEGKRARNRFLVSVLFVAIFYGFIFNVLAR